MGGSAVPVSTVQVWREHTNCREFLARHSNHRELSYFASTAQIEEGQAHNTDFLVRCRGTASNETGGVLAGTNLSNPSQNLYNLQLGHILTIKTSGGAILYTFEVLWRRDDTRTRGSSFSTARILCR